MQRRRLLAASLWLTVAVAQWLVGHAAASVQCYVTPASKHEFAIAQCEHGCRVDRSLVKPIFACLDKPKANTSECSDKRHRDYDARRQNTWYCCESDLCNTACIHRSKHWDKMFMGIDTCFGNNICLQLRQPNEPDDIAELYDHTSTPTPDTRWFHDVDQPHPRWYMAAGCLNGTADWPTDTPDKEWAEQKRVVQMMPDKSTESICGADWHGPDWQDWVKQLIGGTNMHFRCYRCCDPPAEPDASTAVSAESTAPPPTLQTTTVPTTTTTSSTRTSSTSSSTTTRPTTKATVLTTKTSSTASTSGSSTTSTTTTTTLSSSSSTSGTTTSHVPPPVPPSATATGPTALTQPTTGASTQQQRTGRTGGGSGTTTAALTTHSTAETSAASGGGSATGATTTTTTSGGVTASAVVHSSWCAHWRCHYDRHTPCHAESDDNYDAVPCDGALCIQGVMANGTMYADCSERIGRDVTSWCGQSGFQCYRTCDAAGDKVAEPCNGPKAHEFTIVCPRIDLKTVDLKLTAELLDEHTINEECAPGTPQICVTTLSYLSNGGTEQQGGCYAPQFAGASVSSECEMLNRRYRLRQERDAHRICCTGELAMSCRFDNRNKYTAAAAVRTTAATGRSALLLLAACAYVLANRRHI